MIDVVFMCVTNVNGFDLELELELESYTIFASDDDFDNLRVEFEFEYKRNTWNAVDDETKTNLLSIIDFVIDICIINAQGKQTYVYGLVAFLSQMRRPS